MILTITCNSMLYVLAEMLALVVCFEMRSHRVAQFGLKLMGSNDPPVSVLAVSIWDYWHFLPHLAQKCILVYPGLCINGNMKVELLIF
jgi:hypothetical protein